MALVPGRRPAAPWLAGAGLLALAVALAAPVVWLFGRRSWPFCLGLAAALVLAFGWIETAWRNRPLARRHRPTGRSRFRIVAGGKDKGNGHAHDVPDPSGDEDKPRWLM
jgi:hypothetical protein